MIYELRIAKCSNKELVAQNFLIIFRIGTSKFVLKLKLCCLMVSYGYTREMMLE